MNFAEFETAAKDALAKAETLIRGLLGVLPPDLQHDAITAAQDGVGDIGALATAEVEKVAPASLDGMFATGIAAIDAKLESDVAALTETANGQKAALATAQQTLAAVPA